MDHFCHLCLVFVILSRLFIAALWSPAGKGLTSGLSFVMFVFLSLSHVVWYLIVSIPDLCHLTLYKRLVKKTQFQNFITFISRLDSNPTSSHFINS